MAYKRVKANGITFVFKYEPDYPELLHIYVRHLKEPDDAIYIFFNGQTTWNTAHDLWETLLDDDEGIWWFWINENDKVAMIVSCFDEYNR